MANEIISNELSEIRQKMHDSVDNMIDTLESTNEKSAEKIAILKDKAIAMKKNLDGYIEKNPEKSVLISAGIGLVAGAIIAAAMARANHD